MESFCAFGALDGVKIRPPTQRTELEVFAVGLLQKLGLGVKVFLHFWKNKWKSKLIWTSQMFPVQRVGH